MKERYDNLDGIRAYSCIGIVSMHVLANGNFGLSGFVFERFIASLTNLVFLFMIISAFSMCCGYYEKFKEGTVDIEKFYTRRYKRIWPFFALLCTLELLIDHSLSSLYEWFADLTLTFGLLPNAGISVVGVGWFLGVVFVFYMLFPFFTFLLWNNKRAWAAMGVSIILTVLCDNYFFNADHVVEDFSSRNNFLYCAIFFIAGGLIYLYRYAIKNTLSRYKWGLIIALIAGLIFYYTVNNSVYTMLALFSIFTILGILGGGVYRKFYFRTKPPSLLAV